MIGDEMFLNFIQFQFVTSYAHFVCMKCPQCRVASSKKIGVEESETVEEIPIELGSTCCPTPFSGKGCFHHYVESCNIITQTCRLRKIFGRSILSRNADNARDDIFGSSCLAIRF